MTDETTETPGQKFERLVEIMARLRSPQGCPWDREQTFDTIKPYLLEETYEVLDAIDARNWRGLQEELGDLLLEAVFFAQMAADERKFSISDSLDAINHKLVRRHPHVFGTGDAKTSEDVKKRWEEIKADEKKDRGETPQSILASVPRSLPALVEAFQISSKVAHIGFDWANTDQVLDKLHEELNELAEARQADSREELENEIGDILFALVNVARHLKVDPEQALRKSNAKFRRRFSHVEKNAQLPGATLEQMEALWQEAKAGEARGRE